MSRLKMILAVAGMGILVTAFQNCGSRVNFGTSGSSTDVSKASGSLVPIADPGTNSTDGMVDPNTNDTDTTTSNTDNTPSDPVTSEMPPSTHSPHSCTHDGSNNDMSSSESGDLVACILDGPGESIKLGLLSADQLGGVNAVAHSVCVSAFACLKLVSQSFKVKGISDRGYCEHNPNVVDLTDAQVQSLLSGSN